MRDRLAMVGQAEFAFPSVPRPTSEHAAGSVDRQRAERQRRMILAHLADNIGRGATDDELAQLLHVDGSTERPRRWELEGAQLIEASATIRRPTRSGKPAVCWFITPAGRKALASSAPLPRAKRKGAAA